MLDFAVFLSFSATHRGPNCPRPEATASAQLTGPGPLLYRFRRDDAGIGFGKESAGRGFTGGWRGRRIFAGQHALNTISVLAAAFGYGTQLYFDFSGYADMAVGLGLLFGLRLPQNFRRPYSAASLSAFWRRWHITLSSFLRDYLYIGLGGNRLGALRRSGNLMVDDDLGWIMARRGTAVLVVGGCAWCPFGHRACSETRPDLTCREDAVGAQDLR